MNRKRKGDVGVSMAIAYYTQKGYMVSVPLTDASRYDLLVDTGKEIKKVQVKTTGQLTANNTPTVTLSTQGGNQSWNGVIKTISEDEVDLVFVFSLDAAKGGMWEFPVSVCAGKRSLNLGHKQENYRVTFDCEVWR